MRASDATPKFFDDFVCHPEGIVGEANNLGHGEPVIVEAVETNRDVARKYWRLGKESATLPHVEILEAVDATAEPNAPESAASLAERLEGLALRLNELSPKVQAAIVWHHRDGYQ